MDLVAGEHISKNNMGYKKIFEGMGNSPSHASYLAGTMKGSHKSKALKKKTKGKSTLVPVKSADDVKRLHGGRTDTYTFRK